MPKTAAIRKGGVLLAGVAGLALVLQGCAAAPSGGEGTAGIPATVQAISQQEKQQGSQYHPQLLAEFGGAVAGPQARYVEDVGKKVAVHSGLSNARDDFTVTLLNSPVNNAFAIPGGYVYVTRQLAALMNNEAELAGVLGHEVGHVAARHSAQRQRAATRNTIVGAVGSILSGVLLGDSTLGQLGQQVFSQGSQLLTLSFSRSQELEADVLGIEYLRRAGYDPRAMSTVLYSLAQQNALDAQLMGTSNRVPEWASTHPDPASRVRTALTRAGENASGTLNRDTYLNNIRGMTYGDDPKQGVVDGRNFTHPDLRLYFQAPNGFYMVNGTRAVTINGQSGKAQFTGAPYSGNMDAYVRSAFAALTQQGQPQIAPASITRTTINGIPAAYGIARVNNGNNQLDVAVFAYEFSREQAFHFLTISQAGSVSQFSPMFNSMRRISTTEAGQVRPRKLDVVAVRNGDTVQSLASRMAFDDAQLERFLVLNGLTADARLRAGDRVKIVTY